MLIACRSTSGLSVLDDQTTQIEGLKYLKLLQPLDVDNFNRCGIVVIDNFLTGRAYARLCSSAAVVVAEVVVVLVVVLMPGLEPLLPQSRPVSCARELLESHCVLQVSGGVSRCGAALPCVGTT